MLTPATLDRLSSERIIWMTTVTPAGQPQTSPVWYLYDGTEFLIWSLDPTARLNNIEANPAVSLNLDGNGTGGAIVTIEGTTAVDRSGPGADEVPDYVSRYRERMDKGWGGPAGFAAKYPTLIRVTPVRARQW